jgi:hypothetical protein
VSGQTRLLHRHCYRIALLIPQISMVAPQPAKWELSSLRPDVAAQSRYAEAGEDGPCALQTSAGYTLDLPPADSGKPLHNHSLKFTFENIRYTLTATAPPPPWGPTTGSTDLITTPCMALDFGSSISLTDMADHPRLHHSVQWSPTRRARRGWDQPWWPSARGCRRPPLPPARGGPSTRRRLAVRFE